MFERFTERARRAVVLAPARITCCSPPLTTRAARPCGPGGAVETAGVDLDRARTALRDVDIAGTSDEPPDQEAR